jgi:hypothetical protein
LIEAKPDRWLGIAKQILMLKERGTGVTGRGSHRWGIPGISEKGGPLEKTIMMLKTKNHERTIHPSEGKIRNHTATPSRGNWKASETPGSDSEHGCQSTTFESMEYILQAVSKEKLIVWCSQKIRPEFKEPNPNCG